MTGRDLVTASLRLFGAVAPGESVAASEASDGLASINRMLDSWSNEGLIIHTITQETPLTLTVSDGTVTVGTSGDITTRPMSIEAAVIRDGSTDYPLNILSLEQYTAIANKSAEATYPTDLYDNGGYPQRTLYLYPVPSAAKQLVLWTKRALTQIATLDTSLSLPPGYERALVYNGAIELCAEYGREPSGAVVKVADESKASIKRANVKPGYLRADSGLLTTSSFNIFTGDSR